MPDFVDVFSKKQASRQPGASRAISHVSSLRPSGVSIKNYMPKLLVSLLLICLSCGADANKELSIKGVDEFHQRYNSHVFAAIYDNAHEELKSTITREGFIEGIRELRDRQGPFIRSREIKTDYLYSSGEVRVKMLFESVFEKGEAGEEFVFLVNDGKPHLLRYRFIPPDAPAVNR